jgi:hypothetical protein
LQDAVSESVSVEIVDALKIVEVYKKKRMLPPVGTSRRRCCSQRFEHRTTIR